MRLRGTYISMSLIAITAALSTFDAAAQSGPTPLMPHPIDGRPVFSQDNFAPEQPNSEALKEPATREFTHDRFDIEERPDYSPQLRKVPEKGHEKSEVEIAKGIIELNASKYDEAEKRFKAALQHDPRNFVAMEYLGAVEEGRGRLEQAVAWYVKAKHAAPEPRWGAINFQLGRLYLFQENYERAEIYLKLAIEQSGHLTAATYTMGYLLYKQGRYFDSHYYLLRAKERATRPAARAEERAMLQAIHYYLGEIYARLGFTNYAITSLRETEYGDSWEIRNAAWRVHSELNRSQFRLAAGQFVQFDSNTILLPSGRTLPVELTTQSSFSSVTTAEAGWQSSSAKPWIVGVDGSLYLNAHSESALKAFDVLSLGTDAWINWWNRRDWLFAARYDFAHALTDRSSFTTFETIHGPGLSATYVPFQRWNYELGLNYRSVEFADDLTTGPDRRNGESVIAYLRVGLKSPTPRFRPQFGYSFQLDDTDGDNFDSRIHRLSGELNVRLFTKTHVTGAVAYELYQFPDNLSARDDKRTVFRLGVNQVLNDHWSILVDMVQLDNNSSSTDFSYSRFTFTSGVLYRL